MNPNVIGRAKTKDCRMTPGHSSPPLSHPLIFFFVGAFSLRVALYALNALPG